MGVIVAFYCIYNPSEPLGRATAPCRCGLTISHQVQERKQDTASELMDNHANAERTLQRSRTL